MVTMMVTMMTKRTATWYGAEGGGTASSGAEGIMEVLKNHGDVALGFMVSGHGGCGQGSGLGI